MTTDMDTSAVITENSAPMDPNFQVDHSSSRTAIAVPRAELSPSDTEGWKVSGKQVRQRVSTTISGESPPILKTSIPNRAAYAKRTATRITKAARMPHTLPREDIKIVMRPRGGLNVARTEASTIMLAVLIAAGISKLETRDDMICTNSTQNIIL